MSKRATQKSFIEYELPAKVLQQVQGGYPMTTMALGEEGGEVTTQALGEEGGTVTSLAIGEEGGDTR